MSWASSIPIPKSTRIWAPSSLESIFAYAILDEYRVDRSSDRTMKPVQASGKQDILLTLDRLEKHFLKPSNRSLSAEKPQRAGLPL
uniref:AlNc14C170G7992 protein n=1 Tax=Albugo laibachii Nc14 TaxID=890382 RepID=F0WNG7_9STRA|nr:AlNc14C170G7992 [Albugo laibachii Nc14]|eukprot:CCA22858.1 AlNc14C170G7992 [Albugo laibachii Nc14]